MRKQLFIFLSIILLAVGCNKDTSGDYYKENGGQKVEMGNPYSSGSGHYAGYEWAEENGGACGGNSSSFNEGCEEYYRQVELSR